MVCKFFASGTPTAAVPKTACSVVGPRITMGQTVPFGLVKANIVDKKCKASVSIAIGAATLVAGLVIGAALPVMGAMPLVIAATSLVIAAMSLAGRIAVAMARVFEELAKTASKQGARTSPTSKVPECILEVKIMRRFRIGVKPFDCMFGSQVGPCSTFFPLGSWTPWLWL